MTAEIIPLAAFRASIAERQVQTEPAPPNPSAEWVLAHPRFSTEIAYNQAAMFGHFHALRCGITPDTPAYFTHVEYFTGDRDLPEGAARPCDQVEYDGKKWLVWDVTKDLQPIVVREGRKVSLTAGTWTRLGDAVKRALEEFGR